MSPRKPKQVASGRKQNIQYSNDSQVTLIHIICQTHVPYNFSVWQDVEYTELKGKGLN